MAKEQESPAAPPQLGRPYAEGRWQPVRLGYSHDALVEQIIANPTATNSELGAIFGRTREWVGLVRSSDLFRIRLHQRHTELADPLLTASLEERLSMVTNRSVDLLLEKLAKPSAEVPDNLVLAAAQFGAKAQAIGGFGPKVAPAPPAIPVDRIEKLAERLERLNHSTLNQEITDVEVRTPDAGEVGPG